jgi:hypothetical protein
MTERAEAKQTPTTSKPSIERTVRDDTFDVSNQTAIDLTHQPLTPKAVLQLQRKHGNAFVSRLVQRMAQNTPKRQTIQRKVGFEAEFNVPSLGAPPNSVDATKLADGPEGQTPTAAIQQFIFGGLEYGQNRGANAHFTLKPDHNELQGKMIAIWQKLQNMGFLKEIPDKTTSNLEYVTTALDELEPGSTTKFNTQFDAVKNHANTLFANVKNSLSAIGDPAVNTYTGLPEAALRNWLGSRYNEVENEVNAFKDAISNEFYIQATVGIIPSAVRDLHQRHTPARGEDVKTATDLAMFAVDQTVTNLLNHDRVKKNPYIKETLEGKKGGLFNIGAKEARPIDYDTFASVVHLIYMYMVGSALNQTNLFDGSAGKNAVPFMSKMSNMRNVITEAAPSLNNNRPPEDLIQLMDLFFKSTNYVKVDWWITNAGLEDRRGTKGRNAIVHDNFVSDMLRGTGFLEDEPQVTTVNTGRSRQFDHPDKIPDKVSSVSGGQQGAQFEYRYISAHPDANGLGDELMNVVREVRHLNTKHVDPDKRATILEEANT